MQHSKTSVTQLFLHPQQYLIPIFQRGYVWTLENQIKPLWEDIADRAQALAEYREKQDQVGSHSLRPLQKHFLGTLVLSGLQNAGFGHVPTVEVIDGQQRISTLQIMLLAYRDVAKTLDDEFINQSFISLTRNPGPYKNEAHYLKVWPTNVGRVEIEALTSLGTHKAVCDSFPLRKDGKKKLPRPLMIEAYLYYFGLISLFLRGKNHDDPWEGEGNVSGDRTLSDQVIHSIRHDDLVRYPFIYQSHDKARAQLLLDTLSSTFQLMALHLEDEDDPQVIFETLNARGAPLFPSDLVRNFLFLQATRKGEDVDLLYNSHWRGFDEKPADGRNQKGDKYWKQDERQGRLKNTRLDLLLFHYMGLRTQEIIKVTHVFQAFKAWWEMKDRNTADELIRVCKAAEVFEKVITPNPTSRFGMFCSRMKSLDTAMLIPVILYLREHHDEESEELLTILTDMESYLVRRHVCGLTTKGYNRIFLKLLADLVDAKRANAASIRSSLLDLKGDSQIWPDDARFEESWVSRPLYQTLRLGKTRMLLEALELAMRTTKHEDMSIPAGLTIEHVLPQGWEPDTWPIKDSSDATKTSRSQLLHTVGNLTLLTQPMNSALSRGPFTYKRPEITKSLLTLNAYFQDDQFLSTSARWAEEEIIKRSKALFTVATRIWPHVPSSAIPTESSGARIIPDWRAETEDNSNFSGVISPEVGAGTKAIADGNAITQGILLLDNNNPNSLFIKSHSHTSQGNHSPKNTSIETCNQFQMQTGLFLAALEGIKPPIRLDVDGRNVRQDNPGNWFSSISPVSWGRKVGSGPGSGYGSGVGVGYGFNYTTNNDGDHYVRLVCGLENPFKKEFREKFKREISLAIEAQKIPLPPDCRIWPDTIFPGFRFRGNAIIECLPIPLGDNTWSIAFQNYSILNMKYNEYIEQLIRNYYELEAFMVKLDFAH